MTYLHAALWGSARVCTQTRRSIAASTRHAVTVHVFDERTTQLTARRRCRLGPFEVLPHIESESGRCVKFLANQAAASGSDGGDGDDGDGDDGGSDDGDRDYRDRDYRDSDGDSDGDSGSGSGRPRKQRREGGSKPGEATAAPLDKGECAAPADSNSDDPSWEADFTLPAGALEAAQLWDGCASSHPSCSLAPRRLRQHAGSLTLPCVCRTVPEGMSVQASLPHMQLRALPMFSQGSAGPLRLVRHGSAGGNFAVLKPAWTRAAADELQSEYAVLKHLEAAGLVSGGVVPAPLALSSAAIVSRQLPVLATAYVGPENCRCLDKESLEAARKPVRALFGRLHAARVAHGDVAWRNIVRRPNGESKGAYTYTLVDFGRARICARDAAGDAALEADKKAVHSLLGGSSDGSTGTDVAWPQ